MNLFPCHSKQIAQVLLLLFLSFGKSAFAHQQSQNELQEQNRANLARLYKTLSKEPSDKLVNMGRELMDVREQYDSAFVCMSVVMNRYQPGMESKEIDLYVAAFTSVGYLYYNHFNDYSRAYDCLGKGIGLMEKEGVENMALCRAYLTTANMFVASAVNYNSDNLVVTALEYYQKCFETAHRIKFWDVFVKAFVFKTSFLYQLRDFDSLKQFLDETDVNDVPSGERNCEYFKLQYQAMQHVVEGRYADARKYFELQGQKGMVSKTPWRYHTLSFANIGQTYESENNVDSAIATYEKILPIAREHNMMDVLTKNYSFIAETYLSKGNESMYAYYNKMYLQAKDSLLTLSGLSQVGEKHYLSMLKQESERAEEMSSKVLNYVIISFVLAIAAFMAYLMLFLVRRKNKYLDERNKLLYERYQQALSQGKNSSVGKKYQYSALSEEEKLRIRDEIERVLNMTDKICQSSFTIEEMAQIIGVNSRYVSQVINECYGENFSYVLAERRVKEACRLYDEHQHGGILTVEAVAQSVGFKARNSLISAFKRFTGLTPSEYQKAAREERQK